LLVILPVIVAGAVSWFLPWDPIFLIGWWGITIWFVRHMIDAPQAHERSKTHPLIIVDDAGLWLQQTGERAAWSEIQSVRWVDFGNFDGVHDSQLVVVSRHQPICVNFAGDFMEIDGKFWPACSVYERIKQRWEQNRIRDTALQPNLPNPPPA
jgi:hypothetical protein